MKLLRQLISNLFFKANPEFRQYGSVRQNVILGQNVKLYSPNRLFDVRVGDYSYIGMYCQFKNVDVGKFCSIGPNCTFGWGIHPTNGISTAPMFYSTGRQNGMTLSNVDKIVEQRRISIGNDVFVGMNVTILDGVTIGHGAVIGAGSVVSKDIPPYAIAVGNPIKILRYRFSDAIIEELLETKWWDFPSIKLEMIERNFFDVQKFIDEVRKENEND